MISSYISAPSYTSDHVIPGDYSDIKDREWLKHYNRVSESGHIKFSPYPTIYNKMPCWRGDLNPYRRTQKQIEEQDDKGIVYVADMLGRYYKVDAKELKDPTDKQYEKYFKEHIEKKSYYIKRFHHLTLLVRVGYEKQSLSYKENILGTVSGAHSVREKKSHKFYNKRNKKIIERYLDGDDIYTLSKAYCIGIGRVREILNKAKVTSK